MMPSAGRNLVALVPMRHHSERVPGKNYRDLAGKPLYAYILETLRQVKAIDDIVVDTDSPLIKEGVQDSFPEITVLDRPEELQGGDVPMNEVLLHDVKQVESRYYLQTHSTNPLLRPDTIRRAIERFVDDYPEIDSLFGVTPLQVRLWSAEGEPINHDPAELLRTQDLPPIYEENSCLYLFERKGFMDRGNRIGDRSGFFEIAYPESLDIDDKLDLRLAELILQDSSGQNGTILKEMTDKSP